MKTATVRDLRTDFRKVSAWLEAGETVQVVKRGKPFARVVPEPRSKTLLGCMAGTAVVPPDLEQPLPVTWEAAK
jgi:antitoxin (DNA-binding transcriptional repressor) of toxin-antitoxin stability system